MAISSEQRDKLLQMQVLCDRVIDRTAALAATGSAIRALNKDLDALARLYQDDWLSICTSGKLSRRDERSLEEAAANGRYSILAQDTIWNALQDARELQLSLAKLLVKSLK